MHMEKAKVGCAVIVRKGDEILFIQRQGSHGDGTWTVPGGHIDFGETPSECVVRETLEETGVTIAHPRFLGIVNDVMPDDGKHYVTLWMEADYVGGEPTITSPREVAFTGWMKWADLPHPRFLPFQNLLDGKLIVSQPHDLPFA